MEQEQIGPHITKFDSKEYDFPETVFVRNIENRVFQGIVLQCLADIDNISLVEGSFIDTILRGGHEKVKGITAEQDSKSQSVAVKVEVNIDYGVSIPEKAEEIQVKVAEKITHMTGLHVSCVHVIFKSILTPEQKKVVMEALDSAKRKERYLEKEIETEGYTDDF